VALTGAAAVRLYDDHVDAVYALIARRVGPILSPGLTGEAFDYARRTWDRFDRTHGTERLFLYGAAVAVIRRYQAAERAHLCGLRAPAPVSAPVDDPLVTRAQTRRSRVVDHRANDDLHRLDGTDVTDGVERPVSGVELAGDGLDDLQRALHGVTELQPDDRDILLLSLWEGCSQAEIAEALDLPVGSIRSSLGRIRRELKLAIDDDARGNTR
jgi:RNA polymerase sigma factor (sigma-70 family)